jgi:hypothetical protein
MSKIAYPKKFIISNGDTVIFKGERYNVSVNEHCEVTLDREGGAEVVKMSRIKKIDREFFGSKDKLLDVTCKFFNISLAELKSGKRMSKDVLARTIVAKILDDEGVHFDVIAETLSRNRTNIYHLLKKCNEMEQFDKGLYDTYLRIKSML